MAVWFRRAIFERAWYVGEEVGAAVEECFCALGDQKRGSSQVVEDGGEGGVGSSL